MEIGGEQYLVQQGQELVVEKLRIPPGEEFVLDRVLMVLDGSHQIIGKPCVSGYRVKCLHREIARGKKIKAIRYKPYTGLKKVRGHRHQYSIIQVLSIEEASDNGS